MQRISIRLLAASALLAGSAPALGADLFQVGEKWVYAHQGPRPMSEDRKPLEGDRLAEVIGVQGEGKERRWLMRHTWGKADPSPGVLQISDDNRMHQIEIAAVGAVAFDPPVPLEWEDLEVGGKRTFETKLAIMGFELAIRYELERRADETIEVPAGKFEGCRRIRAITHSSDMVGQPTKTLYDYWFHPRANGLVKESFVFNYQTEDSYTGTSELKSHTKP